VKACALNHVDTLLLDGRFPPPEGLPHVNGCEVTGTIETLGEGVSGRARGERVVIFPGFSCGTCEFCLRGERTVCLRYGYLGAEHVVNYRTQDFVEEAKRWTGKRGVDVVVEHIGGETFERSSYALSRLGTLVSIGSHDTHWGRLDLRHVYSKNLRIVGTNLGSIAELRTVLE